MNPIRKIKDYNTAQFLLNQLGYRGDLLEALSEFMEVSDQMAQRLRDYNQMAASAGEVTGAAGTETDYITYFVPYLFSGTEYHNGGQRFNGTGMTMVNVAGGIHQWQDVLNTAAFIKNNHLQAAPNAQVTLMGFFEVKQ